MGSLKCGEGSGHDDNCNNTLGFTGDIDCCYDADKGQTKDQLILIMM